MLLQVWLSFNDFANPTYFRRYNEELVRMPMQILWFFHKSIHIIPVLIGTFLYSFRLSVKIILIFWCEFFISYEISNQLSQINLPFYGWFIIRWLVFYFCILPEFDIIFILYYSRFGWWLAYKSSSFNF